MQRLTSAWIRIAVLAAVWGCSFLFIKVGLEGMQDTQIVFGRIVLGALTLLALVVVRREPLPSAPRVWLHLAVMGVTANVVPFLGFAWGEEHGATSGLAGIYNATTPLWTLVFVMATLPQERPTRSRLSGVLLGFIGVALVLAPWHHVAGTKLGGQFACLGAGLCYGVSFTYTRRYLTGRGSPLALATGQLLCATVEFAVFVPLVATRSMHLHPRVWLSVLALGAAGTGLAYVVYYGLIRDVGPTTASTVTYLVPLVAVTLGVLALHEHVSWNDFVGAAVVIAGVLVADGRLDARGVVARSRGGSQAWD